MVSMNVSSCRCCILMSSVHPVAFLNAEFCITCMQEATIWKRHTPEPVS